MPCLRLPSMSAALPPALARLRWNASPEELTAAAAGVQAHGDAVLQQVADAREATASHVLLPLMTMDRDMEVGCCARTRAACPPLPCVRTPRVHSPPRPAAGTNEQHHL
ncbi:hypothetical protein EON62_03530, partial [archaeon]